MKLGKEFWDNLYRSNDTGWDQGGVTSPLKNYFDQLKNKNLKILIPGCGNSYEAEYLFQQGFKNVHVLDISPVAIDNFKKRVSSFPLKQIYNEDFFKHKEKYDLIIEQTFFCAINPEWRELYAKQMHDLLNRRGKLAGLFFDKTISGNEPPPFGGTKNEYQKLFSKYFKINTLARCKNSIKPRKGRELFFIFVKK